jgi:hypothetical protein
VGEETRLLRPIFFASAVGYAKSFFSNNHEFCFLGATEALRKTKSKAKRENTEGAEATEAQSSESLGRSSWRPNSCDQTEKNGVA